MAEKRLVKSLVGNKPKKFSELQREGDVLRSAATKQTVFEEDLSEALRKKLFLFSPKIKCAEMFYLQCWRVILKYSVAYFKESRADRGSIEFIVDPIKGSAANEDKVNLRLSKKSLPKDAISDKTLDKAKAEKKVVIDARWKVLLARYKKPAEIEVVSVEPFYRPYYKVSTVWRNKEEIQWVPADDFGNYFVYN